MGALSLSSGNLRHERTRTGECRPVLTADPSNAHGQDSPDDPVIVLILDHPLQCASLRVLSRNPERCIMLRLFINLSTIVLSTGVSSQTRPLTTSMTCAQAAGRVASQGAVVLNTGPYTYDRYVSGPNSCAYGEFPDPAWVPMADTMQCFVGYQCRNRSQVSSGR